MSFLDPFTPMQPLVEIPRPSPEIGVYTVIGSFEATITSTPQYIREIVAALNPGQGYSYGQATGVMVQENPANQSGAALVVYYWLGAVGFHYDRPTNGPYVNQAPFIIATNRYQLDNMQLQASGGGTIQLSMQFFTGNPNVSP